MLDAAAIPTDPHDDTRVQQPTQVVDPAHSLPDLSELHHVDVEAKNSRSLPLPLLPLNTPDPTTPSLPLVHADIHSATTSTSNNSREGCDGSRQPPAEPMSPLRSRGISTSSTLGPSSAPRTWRLYFHNHRRFFFLLFLVTTFLVIGTYAMARYKDEFLQVAQYIQDQAPLSAVYMSLLLVLWIVLCLPATLLEIIAGMIYTWPVAVVSITVGKQIGNNLGFWLGQCITTGSFKEVFLGRLAQRKQEAEARGAAIGESSSETEGMERGEIVGGALEVGADKDNEESDIENSRTALQRVTSGSSHNNGSSTSIDSALNLPHTNTTIYAPTAVEPVAEPLPLSLPTSSELPVPVPPATSPPSPPRVLSQPPPSPLRRRRRKTTPIEALTWAVKTHPWQICFLLRLLPLPIAVKNYGMSCLPFPLLVYTLCCFVAELPFTILWVHIGQSTRSLLEAMEGRQRGKSHLLHEILLLVLSVVLLVALGFLMRRYTAKYAKHLEEEREKEEAEEEAEEERRRVAAAAAAAGGRIGDGGGGGGGRGGGGPVARPSTEGEGL